MPRQLGFIINDGANNKPESISFYTFAGFFKTNYNHIKDVPKSFELTKLDELILNLLSEGNFKSVDRIFMELHQAGHKVDLRNIRKRLSIMRRKNIL